MSHYFNACLTHDDPAITVEPTILDAAHVTFQSGASNIDRVNITLNDEQVKDLRNKLSEYLLSRLREQVERVTA